MQRDDVDLQLFPDARDFAINDGTFIQARSISAINVGRGHDLNGFEFLRQHICLDAFHNSNDQFEPPKCHVNTRVAVLKRIADWVDNPGSKKLLWLSGPAGAGKSAIARSISEQLEESNKLAASFFFSRMAVATGRDSTTRLISTIVYQVALAMPRTREFIIKAIERDPTIFSRSLERQVKCLLTDPLHESPGLPEDEALKLVVIDGLDECRDEKMQLTILRVISSLVQQQDIPLCFLVVSRPELHICRVFEEKTFRRIFNNLILDHSFKPDKDIERYLRSCFKELKRDHVLRDHIPTSWPSDQAIMILIDRSSGQFIYASTVIKYISAPDEHPDAQLEVILGISSAQNGDTPFAQLDMLYKQILSTVKNWKLTCRILGSIIPSEAIGLVHIPKEIPFIDGFLCLKSGASELALSRLNSVLYFGAIDPGHAKEIKFYHKSLLDFFVDSSRSGEYCMDICETREYFARCSLAHLISGAITDCRLHACQALCPLHSSEVHPLEIKEQFSRCRWDRCIKWTLHSKSYCKVRMSYEVVLYSMRYFFPHLAVLDVSSAEEFVRGIDPLRFMKSLFERKTSCPSISVLEGELNEIFHMFTTRAMERKKFRVPRLHIFHSFRRAFDQHILEMLSTYPQDKSLPLFIAACVLLRLHIPRSQASFWSLFHTREAYRKELIFKIINVEETVKSALIDADDRGLRLLNKSSGPTLEVWPRTFLENPSRAGNYYVDGRDYERVALRFQQYYLNEANSHSNIDYEKQSVLEDVIINGFRILKKASPLDELAGVLRSNDFDSPEVKNYIESAKVSHYPSVAY